MKKLLMLAVMMMIATSAFAAGVLSWGGTRSECTDLAWTCNAYKTCIVKGAETSEEYKACAREYTSACMAKKSCDAKKAFPYLWK